MDRKDALISVLTQQRDDALNKMANLFADAETQIGDLRKKIDDLEKQLQENGIKPIVVNGHDEITVQQ